MRPIVNNFKLNSAVLICSLLLSGCVQSVPVYNRTYVNGVIKEEAVGIYKDKKIPEILLEDKTDTSLVGSDSKMKFIKMISFFRSSAQYREERSIIDRLIWDFDQGTIHIQLKNCRYFVLIESDIKSYFKFLESGVVGPC